MFFMNCFSWAQGHRGLIRIECKFFLLCGSWNKNEDHQIIDNVNIGHGNIGHGNITHRPWKHKTWKHKTWKHKTWKHRTFLLTLTLVNPWAFTLVKRLWQRSSNVFFDTINLQNQPDNSFLTCWLNGLDWENLWEIYILFGLISELIRFSLLPY